MVKNQSVYGDTIGVSRKLKSVYENIPYRILSIKYFNVILENILDGSQVLRAVDDVKKIGIIDNNEENFKNVPKEVFKMLNVLTYENIKEIFENKKDENPKMDQRVTRSKRINDIERDKQMLLEEFFNLDEEDFEDIEERHVRFDI